MKSNIGTIDRAVRILVAIVIISLYAASQITGMAAIILLTLAGAFILTSFIGFCPLYLPFNLSTRKKG